MKIKIGNNIYDSDNEPLMLIFDDDNQRKTVAKHLTDMQDNDGIRKYAIFNKKVLEEDIKKFMKL